MNHSKQETFFWLEDAHLLKSADIVLREVNELDGAEQKGFWAGQESAELLTRLKALPDKTFSRIIRKTIASHPTKILDYSRVQKSRSLAQDIVISLARREVSIDELDKHLNEPGDMASGALRLRLKKVALAHVGATGNINDRLVAAALSLGKITMQDVDRAKRKRKRRALVDLERISIVARFLVKFWCGEKGDFTRVRQRRGRVEMFHIFSCYEKDGRTVSRNVPGAKFRIHRWPRQQFFVPPLCFFNNKTLSTFCAIGLNMSQSAPETSVAAIKQWVSRLQLERPNHSAAPKIREVRQQEDGLCFYH